MTDRADAAWRVAVESAIKELEVRCLDLGRAQAQHDVMSYSTLHELLEGQRKYVLGLLGMNTLVNLELDITGPLPKLWIDGKEMRGGRDVKYLQCWAATHFSSGTRTATREEAIAGTLAEFERGSSEPGTER